MFRTSLSTVFALFVLISAVSANTTRHNSCKLIENSCEDDLDCCSRHCFKHPLISEGGRCKRKAETYWYEFIKLIECKPTNEPCRVDWDCCSFTCLKIPPDYIRGYCRKPVVTDTIKRCIFNEPIYSSSAEHTTGYPITAINSKLAVGTMVRVTLRNENSTVVLINANGPFGEDEVINLSLAAAVDLGITKYGEMNCKVEVVDGLGCLGENEKCRRNEDCCFEYCIKPDEEAPTGRCNGLSIDDA